jgi:hypothetical protein
MKFKLTADKMVMIDGKIITIKAGDFETTDKATCEALQTVTCATQVKVKKQKKAD